MSKDVFDKIVLTKDFSLQDVSNVLEISRAILLNKDLNGITFKNEYKNKEFYEYINDSLTNIFKNEKQNIIDYCHTNIDMSKEQIFEYNITFPTGLYMNPMFSKAKALNIIDKYNVPSIDVPVEHVMEFSRRIECDGISEDTSPIIILKQPFSLTGYAVIDGNHRVKQAYKKGEKSIKAYLLDNSFEEDIFINPLFNEINDLYLILIVIIEYKLGHINDMEKINIAIKSFKEK